MSTPRDRTKSGAVAPDGATAGVPAKARRARGRQIAAFGLGALVALFAVLNLDDVEVRWIIGTAETPLIIVIAVSVVVGAALGWIVARRKA